MAVVTKISMVTLLLMIFVIPQSFMHIKLPFLAVVLLWVLHQGVRDAWRIRSRETIFYYLIFSLLTVTWCIVGLLRGNAEIAVIEALRVYFIYMWIYFALVIYISNIDYQKHVDQVIVLGALGIGVVALYALANHIFQLGWLPKMVEEEMYLQVGLHQGYVQMNNVNIGMLTFIVPYLLSRVLLSEKRSPLLLLGLIVAMLSAIFASRRMVLLLIFIAPVVAYAIAALAGDLTRLRRWRFVRFYVASLLAGALGAWILIQWSPDSFGGLAARASDAFTTDPQAPRPLQHAALLEGFAGQYVWGSGFGGLTSVVRADERPWTYELTYSRLLFNSGLLGIGLLVAFFASYAYLVLRKIRGSHHASIYISLMVGFVSVLIASASNPYLTSFDFIFAFSIIPLILNTRDLARKSVSAAGARL